MQNTPADQPQKNNQSTQPGETGSPDYGTPPDRAAMRSNQQPDERVLGEPGIHVEYFRPVDAISTLAKGAEDGTPEYEKVKTDLQQLPGFLRIQENDLTALADRFEHTVNITGFSGQGVHPSQQELLKRALDAILAEKGWNRENSVLVSGGTAVGTPDLAISHLSQDKGYTSIGIMALPGVRYPLTSGYSCVCVDEQWSSWGDEADAMAEISNATILSGGGAQALTDALKAAQDNEDIAVITNAYNGLSRVEYEVDGTRRDVIVKNGVLDQDDDGVLHLSQLREEVLATLQEQGERAEDLENLKITALPVSGLVTEVRNGNRRACGQDLLYFCMTRNSKLLPEEFQNDDPVQNEALQKQIVKHLDLYYLLDDPAEGLGSSAVVKINELLDLQMEGVLGKIIDHAVMHDVHNPATDTFGPEELGARSPEELAEILKQGLKKCLEHRPMRKSA